MKLIVIIIFFLIPNISIAKLKVVTTTTTLAEFVKQVGRDKVEVTSLTKPQEDPHFVEAKPSYMVKLRQADLLVAVGLELEVGWLSNVQRGAKNPKLLDKKFGFFTAGDFINAIEIPKGKVDCAQGDVHPFGNPHFHLSPVESQKVILALAKKLGELEPNSKTIFMANAEEFNKVLESQISKWQERVNKSKIRELISYHKSFNYFLNFFNITPIAYIEPKPGVPPTPKHIIQLIKLIKDKKIKCIFNESYFETTAAKRLQKVTQATLKVVPVEVETNYIDLIEKLVSAIEDCSKGVM